MAAVDGRELAELGGQTATLPAEEAGSSGAADTEGAFGYAQASGRGRQGEAYGLGFANEAQFLLVSEASVEDLNRRIGAAGGEPVEAAQMRANLVVSGGEAYAEDKWEEVEIGRCKLRVVGPCGRCSMITIDQRTGEHTRSHTLAVLAGYRRTQGKIAFGVLMVGDECVRKESNCNADRISPNASSSSLGQNQCGSLARDEDETTVTWILRNYVHVIQVGVTVVDSICQH
ncbi:hypothetical protein CYMTET_13269 [Cymbomonas tetramitiformis]|uniref:MOSC domain-containing protein n=1 Tax=Cymbomonas tetramitiformis TaxID=36881 RepID=A0AAE0LB21_9CHLO|nr:hypothetical protein CYMTET_13269 [Cymbomonas tetramitiformis]